MKFTEDTLLRHAQFICDQVLSLDNCAGTDDTLLITAPCIRSLMKLSGVTLGKKSAIRPMRRQQKIKTPTWSMATTTKLVSNMFENIFAGQLAKHNNKVFISPHITIIIFFIHIVKHFYFFISYLKEGDAVFATTVINLSVVFVLLVKICRNSEVKELQNKHALKEDVQI